MDMKKLLTALGFRTQRELVAAMGLQESAASHWKTKLGDGVRLRLVGFAEERGAVPMTATLPEKLIALGLDE